AFVRSAHAHARLGRVDAEAARRAPDVVGVLGGAEAARLCKPYRGVLAHFTGMKTGAMQPLALERVRYVGEPIVAVAATSRAAAEDAARLVAVEYEPLPAVLDPGQALAPGAPLIHGELGDNLIYETRLTAGDVPPGAGARPPRQVGGDAPRVVSRRHPRPRAVGARGGRGGRRWDADRDARPHHGGRRSVLCVPALERRRGRPGPPPPARPVPASQLRRDAPGGRPEQEDHLPVPRRRACARD